jgi:hypothetical protein
MKKVITLFVFSFVLSTFVASQTPQYYNYNTTNAGNSLPLGTYRGSLVQWLLLPGEINQPAPAISGNITKFYFRMIGNIGYKYYKMSIILGQTTLTSFPIGSFYTGIMDTVFYRDSVYLSSTGMANWLGIQFDHPFYYDKTKSLVIQVEQYSSNIGISQIHGHTLLTGKRRNYTSIPPFYLSNQDGYMVNFGVDITPVSSVEPNSAYIPNDYNLKQNYPNPFNPETIINFDLPKSGFVSLKVYDILGKEITTLVYEMKNAGSYDIKFDGSTLSNGMYFSKLETNGYTSTKKMFLVK